MINVLLATKDKSRKADFFTTSSISTRLSQHQVLKSTRERFELDQETSWKISGPELGTEADSTDRAKQLNVIDIVVAKEDEMIVRITSDPILKSTGSVSSRVLERDTRE